MIFWSTSARRSEVVMSLLPPSSCSLVSLYAWKPTLLSGCRPLYFCVEGLCLFGICAKREEGSSGESAQMSLGRGRVMGSFAEGSWGCSGTCWMKVLTSPHHKEYSIWLFLPPFVLCSQNPERWASGFHEAPGTGQNISLQSMGTSSFLGPRGFSSLNLHLACFSIPLFFYLFYFHGLNLFTSLRPSLLSL